MESIDSVGGRIRKARKNKQFTLADVCNCTGLSTGNLSELENNKFMPSSSALITFKKVLGVSIDWLLTGEENISVSYNGFNPAQDEDLCVLKEISGPAYGLSEEEKKLIEDFRKIDEEKRRDILGFIGICLTNQKNYKD